MSATDDDLQAKLDLLKIRGLRVHWDALIDYAEKKKLSHVRFLQHVVDVLNKEREAYSLEMRLKRATIPEMFLMATYPFARQPKLNRAKILNIFDSLDYIRKKENIILLGPTSVGKTGLATSFLVNAIENGFTGRFITFPQLISDLNKAIALQDEERVLKRFAAYECLICDELGYVEVDAAKVGLFFRLLSLRYKRRCTIITSNLGFQQWRTFLKNDHLTSALIERTTSNSHVFNMKDCVGLRPKPQTQA